MQGTKSELAWKVFILSSKDADEVPDTLINYLKRSGNMRKILVAISLLLAIGAAHADDHGRGGEVVVTAGLARPSSEAFWVIRWHSLVPSMCNLPLSLSLSSLKAHTADRRRSLFTRSLSNLIPAVIVTGIFSVKLAGTDAATLVALTQR